MPAEPDATPEAEMNETSYANHSLTSLEIALGGPIGSDPLAPPLPRPDPSETMLAALERSMFEAVIRGNSVVAFSGGRDSSALLALAVRIARREGVDLPRPLTFRFRGASNTEESKWQEEVIRWLELDEWEQIWIDDELDMVGPVASNVLRRHGLLAPFNAFMLDVLLERAQGGALITGAFGDEVLEQDPWLVRRRMVLLGKTRPRGRDLLRIGFTALPRRVRAAVDISRGSSAARLPMWLTPEARAQAIRALAEDRSQKPLHFAREVEWWWGRRYAQVMIRSFRRVAAEFEGEIVIPFLDPRFLSTFAATGKWFGFINRAQLMQLLFGDLLPDRTVKRTSKATFEGVFWNAHTTRFIADWEGEGLDAAMVDVERLRDHWKQRPGEPSGRDFRAALLLQGAWLAVNRQA
jgi:hypothetical protein